MQIRKLAAEEHNRTRRLYEEVFSEDSTDFVDYYYKEKTRDNTIWVIEEDGDIQAMLHLNPYELMVNEIPTQTHYIVAVATRKEYRSRGYMRMLLIRAMLKMREEGECFTWLMPAAEAIYTPYDFRTVAVQNITYASSPEDNEYPDAEGITCMRLCGEQCGKTAEAMNKILAESEDIYALRSAGYYRRLIKEYAADGGTLMLRRRKEGIIDVNPFVPWEEEAHKIMFRILNVESMLHFFKAREDLAFTFRIEDLLIRGNEGTYRITARKGEYLAVEKLTDNPTCKVISICVLTDILFGTFSFAETSEVAGEDIAADLADEWRKVAALNRISLNEAV